jgi:ribose transport system substrate-binding protein
MLMKWTPALAMGLGLALAHPALAQQDTVAAAKAFVAQVTKPNPPWDGPTTGPKIEPGKTVVYVSTDQRNGGARGVGVGVAEAAKLVGWKYREMDGQGTVSGRSDALNQAIARKPDAIILGAIDATEQSAAVEAAAKQHIVVVGWHSFAKPGPSDKLPVFTNITTDPLQVAKAAASYAIADSDGKAEVVIFTDSAYQIAIAKSDAMAATIKACSTCKVLSVEDTPLADASSRMGPLTTALLQRFGDKWTYGLSINDLTFDFMAPSLASAGVAGNGYPRNISAGDGSESAFERIRADQYQVGTVAEPLRLHGWQLVDEMNRAFAGEKPSGYVAPAHLFTPENIKFDGGPNNIYDPDNGYQDAYKKIWGVK